MQRREAVYSYDTKDSVYFGVGSYGSDESRGGLCYRMSVAGIDRDIIAQVITQGGENTAAGSFNLLMADGGFTDQYTACTAEGTPVPQFAGSSSSWGSSFGGWQNMSGCSQLPEYPICGNTRHDSMKQLCENTFVKGFRVGNSIWSNPTITSLCQVKCPDPLWQATGLRRSDEANQLYTCGATMEPSGGDLTRSMDCSKPSYAWEGRVIGKTYNSTNIVIPCRRDGYTRINSHPTLMPTPEPTYIPPTPTPTQQPLCCQDTYYHINDAWKNCENAADASLIKSPHGPFTNCSTCLAYQCVDWTAGSVGMKQRQKAFFERTGVDVYFGVGSYGDDVSRGGLCYRLGVMNTSRDIIVQVISTGARVGDGNFNLLMGGGNGQSNAVNSACTAGSGVDIPQFPGDSSQWGSTVSGWGSKSDCTNLPSFPTCGYSPQDDLQQLCQWGFSANLRTALGSSPPVIHSMCPVKCPFELYFATGLHRWDEVNSDFQCAPNIQKPPRGFLSKSMDCGKPSMAWQENIRGVVDPNHSIVIPCKRDGYTRVNVVPYYMSTEMPTEEPTMSFEPTMMPSNGTEKAKASSASVSIWSLASTKFITGVSVGVFMGVILLIVLVCEFWLRMTRRKEFRERVRNKQMLRGMA